MPLTRSLASVNSAAPTVLASQLPYTAGSTKWDASLDILPEARRASPGLISEWRKMSFQGLAPAYNRQQMNVNYSEGTVKLTLLLAAQFFEAVRVPWW